MRIFEYVVKRDEKLEILKGRGYIEINEFMDSHNISEQALIDAQLLCYNELMSTIDYYHYHITKKGNAFLRQIKSTELILVRPSYSVRLMVEVDKEHNHIAQVIIRIELKF